jgi:hypothetical protein
MSNNRWNNFNNSNSNSNNSRSSRSNRSNRGCKVPQEHEFEMRQGLENHYGMPLQEEAKVAQYVNNIYSLMYALGNGGRPTNWINAIVGTYKDIRRARVMEFRKKRKITKKTPNRVLEESERQERKKEYASALKGLRMPIIVGCILRCLLIQDNVGIPARILLRYMNDALKMSAARQLDKTPITLEQFENYRFDEKKGIKKALKKVVPKCYQKEEPDKLVQFTGFSLLGMNRVSVFKAVRLARNITNEFSDMTASGDIAIAALFTVLVIDGYDYKKALPILTISQEKSQIYYSTFFNSKKLSIKREFKEDSISPSALYRKSKSPQKSVSFK